MAFVTPLPLSSKPFTPRSPVCRHSPSLTPYRSHLSMKMVQSPVIASAANIDWENLGFSYLQTACNMRSIWKDGAWSPLVRVEEPYVKLHIGATAIHYGQSCFEGLKAFYGRDGHIRIFRPDQNAARLRSSAKRLVIPEVPESLFLEAVHAAVRENRQFVPPYGTGGSLYIRPVLFGSGAKIGLQTSDEFTFLVMVVPVGDYYKGGLSPVTAVVMEQFDRAAPKGIGHVKVAANYAADLLPNIMGKDAGYPINLYLDAQNGRTIEEFGTSNFIALRGNKYITPDSPSVLPSITNKTLMELAEDEGMVVERRQIDIDEVDQFEEVGACGTAVVVTAVNRIVRGDKVYNIGKNPHVVGPRLMHFYKKVRAIQYGEEDDVHGWGQVLDTSKQS